jgi:cardiolipin synthase
MDWRPVCSNYRQPLLPGNCVQAFENGDEAYPAMLAAIDQAERSVTLASYIFDDDAAGKLFALSLQRAHERGVEVRVLIDGLGLRYSRPDMLKACGAPACLQPRSRRRTTVQVALRQLRNHRKIMVVDGAFGFTGGMNIREGTGLLGSPAPGPLFALRGPGPCRGRPSAHFRSRLGLRQRRKTARRLVVCATATRGAVLARGIADGPDADIDNMPQVLLGALAVARSRVVSSPVLPARRDDHRRAEGDRVARCGSGHHHARAKQHPRDGWATRPQLGELIDSGCRVHLSPAPFDHTKAFPGGRTVVVDRVTNWDARSLRLNFEYNLSVTTRAW